MSHPEGMQNILWCVPSFDSSGKKQNITAKKRAACGSLFCYAESKKESLSVAKYSPPAGCRIT